MGSCPVHLIQIFYEWYSTFFVYLNLVICCIGVATNTINFVAFTRKRLKSATAAIIAATAISDVGTTVSYARMAWYTYLYEPGYPMQEVYTHHAALERLICRHFFVLFYNVSIWLQVILAMWRCLAVFYPLHCRRLCSMKITYWSIAACYVSSTLLFAPRFLSGVKLNEATDKTWPNVPLYRLTYVDDFMRSLHYMIQTWLYQFLPCLALTVFTVALVWCLLKSERIRHKMSAAAQSSTTTTTTNSSSLNNHNNNNNNNNNHCGPGRKKKISETEKTTRMLTVLLAIFWFIEAYVGVISFLRSFGGSYCYVYAITFADTLRLANIAFKIFIYYTMSGHYRTTVHELFFRRLLCKPPADEKEGTTVHTETYSTQG